MSDIDNITLEKCKSFFHTYYSVSNAVIAVVLVVLHEVLARLADHLPLLVRLLVPLAADPGSREASTRGEV